MKATRLLRKSRIVRALASLRLTVTCLILAGILILAGTLAQVDRGIWQVQEVYFQSLVIWVPFGESISLPLLPGGHLIGIVLVLNLLAAHLTRFRLSWRKSGIQLIHAGLILVLMGQFATDLYATESSLILDEGAQRNYTESHFDVELALIDTSDQTIDRVHTIPWSRLQTGKQIDDERLPIRIEIVKTLANSRIVPGHQIDPSETVADRGTGVGVSLVEVARATKTDERDVPAAYIRLGEGGQAGTWLVSTAINQPQSFTWKGRSYTIALRHERYYLPFSVRLTDFTHEKHAGTQIPSSFVSEVEIVGYEGAPPRSQSIYMNHPMRLDGKTFYQASFANNDTTSILQVVDNPAWITPYLACGMIALGMTIQFTIGLTRARRPKQEAAA